MSLQIGVLRSYAVRHGPGPLPTETSVLASVVKEHNQTNEWQGAVRYGWFDAVLARYALGVNGGVEFFGDNSHGRTISPGELEILLGISRVGRFRGSSVASTVSQDGLTGFPRQSLLSLSQRAQFTQALFDVKPVFETCAANDEKVIQMIETLLGQQIGIISNGVSAKNIQLLHPIPS